MYNLNEVCFCPKRSPRSCPFCCCNRPRSCGQSCHICRGRPFELPDPAGCRPLPLASSELTDCYPTQPGSLGASVNSLHTPESLALDDAQSQSTTVIVYSEASATPREDSRTHSQAPAEASQEASAEDNLRSTSPRVPNEASPQLSASRSLRSGLSGQRETPKASPKASHFTLSKESPQPSASGTASRTTLSKHSSRVSSRVPARGLPGFTPKAAPRVSPQMSPRASTLSSQSLSSASMASHKGSSRASMSLKELPKVPPRPLAKVNRLPAPRHTKIVVYRGACQMGARKKPMSPPCGLTAKMIDQLNTFLSDSCLCGSPSDCDQRTPPAAQQKSLRDRPAEAAGKPPPKRKAGKPLQRKAPAVQSQWAPQADLRMDPNSCSPCCIRIPCSICCDSLWDPLANGLPSMSDGALVKSDGSMSSAEPTFKLCLELSPKAIAAAGSREPVRAPKKKKTRKLATPWNGICPCCCRHIPAADEPDAARMPRKADSPPADKWPRSGGSRVKGSHGQWLPSSRDESLDVSNHYQIQGQSSSSRGRAPRRSADGGEPLRVLASDSVLMLPQGRSEDQLPAAGAESSREKGNRSLEISGKDVVEQRQVEVEAAVTNPPPMQPKESHISPSNDDKGRVQAADSAGDEDEARAAEMPKQLFDKLVDRITQTILQRLMEAADEAQSSEGKSGNDITLRPGLDLKLLQRKRDRMDDQVEDFSCCPCDKGHELANSLALDEANPSDVLQDLDCCCSSADEQSRSTTPTQPSHNESFARMPLSQADKQTQTERTP